MMVKHVFIVGMPKSGTTSLAQWMVASGLAQYRVPGVKEPRLYTSDDPHPPLPASDLPLLDATPGYAASPGSIARLPEYDTRLVVCLRNAFERAWSHYKMFRLYAADSRSASDYMRSFPASERIQSQAVIDQAFMFHYVSSNMSRYFPRRSHAAVRQYLEKEFAHISTHSFIERVEYEMAFYLSRRAFPLFSVLSNSLYYFPLRTLLDKYQPSDVSVVSVGRLADADARREFVEGVFGQRVETPAMPVVFSHAEVDIDLPKPDFRDAAFDRLRAFFRYDLAQARVLIAQTRFGDRLLDNAALDR